jgi:hypothetical protein
VQCRFLPLQVGNQIARAKNDNDLKRIMRVTYSGQRFRNILDASLNSHVGASDPTAQTAIGADRRAGHACGWQGDDLMDVVQDLPEAERRLFRAGYDTSSGG